MRRYLHGLKLVIPFAAFFCLSLSAPGAARAPLSAERPGAVLSLLPSVTILPLRPAAFLADVSPAQDGGDAQGRVRRPPDKGMSAPPRQGERAVPREQAPPRADAPPRSGDRDRPPRNDRREPHRSNVPPPFFAVPHAYAFEPIDRHIGFYYHPYFGFYVGPYYGPFYPFPGPLPRHTRYAVSSLRLKVKPSDTAVYLNGYYAGIADDFDGIFQRLYVPSGGHHLEFRLDGYASYEQDVYVSAGDTTEVAHQMMPLKNGTRVMPPPVPRPVPGEWTTEPPDLDEPASPYGILVIRPNPADAQLLIDDDAWGTTAGRAEFVIHLPAGAHRVEVRKAGYRTFTTTVELLGGRSVPLNVTLDPVDR